MFFIPSAEVFCLPWFFTVDGMATLVMFDAFAESKKSDG